MLKKEREIQYRYIIKIIIILSKQKNYITGASKFILNGLY